MKIFSICKSPLAVMFLLLLAPHAFATDDTKVIGAKKVTPSVVDVLLSGNKKMSFDFYADNIFRMFQDNSGGVMRDPESKPEAKMLLENPRKPLTAIRVTDQNNLVTISNAKISITVDKRNGFIKIINLANKAVVLEQASATRFEKERVFLTLKEHANEYFYGGGVQNGRFSHKGKSIAIENQNRWTDAGVASPAPYYWSSKGYGMMWYTFKKGKYDFGSKEKGLVKLSHETGYLDVFFMIGEGAVALLNDYYQLTGNPVLLPKFGFYQGHLNAYNRDFWKEDSTGILFEDGKRYKESQKDNGGIKESLNGEKNNYQFSARAVIDRYKNNDMPFGWLLPNDGYGAGYGQTETLDGNIGNLKSLGEYARKNGVEIGLWTQSDLHPKPEVSALLQRDILKEVKDAGVRVLKTDVAWVGAGYSFGLNGVSDVAQIMPQYGNDARPFIISLDGWAGTQRYAAVWSGDQTGGLWEYIRFHIPTYIGSGLSGLSNITSDMDGIFGGRNTVVNTRDFQWKTFTPMQLNMDGWGLTEKYPQALGEPVASMNRYYLKLKSELIPYTYSIAREAVTGLPMMRAMFLAYPNAYTQGNSTRYQYLYGPNFLVAPIYQSTRADEKGNDIRDGIYLPKGTWIDYVSGEKYTGDRIINNFAAPIWKLPVFVKQGAIIPVTNANNNVSEINKTLRIYEIYPYGKSSFKEYDDDGVTEQYKTGKGAFTLIESSVDEKNTATIIVHPAVGSFDGFTTEKTTEFRINLTVKPKKISARIEKKEIVLTEVNSREEFARMENVYFYDAAPNLNKFSTKGSEFEKLVINKNPQLLVKTGRTDVGKNAVSVTVEGFRFEPADKHLLSTGPLTAPGNAQVSETNSEAYTLKPTWLKVKNADFYEIFFNGMLYSTISDTALLFEALLPETPYSFKIRSVNKSGYSAWKEFKATTRANPLKYAIQGIVGETNAEMQRGSGMERMFDYDETNLWTTRRGVKSVPFDMVIDLKSTNQLDRFQYLPPKIGRGTTAGIFFKGQVFYSENKDTWTGAGSFDWANNDDMKTFSFPSHPSARYIKIAVTEALGDVGSARELYVFKVPDTESYLPGDINHDQKIDRNDFISYTNYTGLRKGDADFEGYISRGDLNQNGLIDAYDISTVATQLEDGINESKTDTVSGHLEISTPKQDYNPGELIEITVKGLALKGVNALSFALPYDAQDYEFTGVQVSNMKKMENLTNDRLHTSGEKVLYATFVNTGDLEELSGDATLFVLKFKAKRKLTFNLKPRDGLLVDKHLLKLDVFR